MLDVRLALPDDLHHMAVADKPVKIRCMQPDHRAKDHEQSMAVYPDHIHCFGCHFHLNGPEASIRYLLGGDVSDLVRYTSEKLDAYRERAAEEAATDPLPAALAEAYHEVLMTERADRKGWLIERGLHNGTITNARLGHDGFRFVIPVFDGPRLLTLRYRRDDEYTPRLPKYLGMPGRNGLYLYAPMLPDETDTVVLCEGELDALRLRQEGMCAVSATNGAGQCHKVLPLIEARFPDMRRLVVATDQDEPGEAAAEQVRQAASGYAWRLYRMRWEGDAKDVTEALTAGLKLRQERY